MILETLLTWAVVTLSSSFMRSAPDYEAPLDNQLLMGELVQTLETSRYWVKVQANDYTGWVTELGLKSLTDEEKNSYLDAPKWICVSVSATVWAERAENSPVLSELSMGDLVRQTGVQKGGWTKVLLPDGRSGWVLSAKMMEFRSWAASRAENNLAREICNLACSFAGVPYMWGGNSAKYFDCSGLVQFCYFMNGIILPRNASQQARCGISLGEGRSYEPGDLLFFGSREPLKISHVGIYLGEGRFVHSSQMVRINTLEEYGREVVAACRILGTVDKGKGAFSVIRSPYYFNTTENGK